MKDRAKALIMDRAGLLANRARGFWQIGLGTHGGQGWGAHGGQAWGLMKDRAKALIMDRAGVLGDMAGGS